MVIEWIIVRSDCTLSKARDLRELVVSIYSVCRYACSYPKTVFWEAMQSLSLARITSVRDG